MEQWAVVQLELSRVAFPQIGCISDFSENDGEPIIGSLTVTPNRKLVRGGPFYNTEDYFMSIAETELARHIRGDASVGCVSESTKLAYAVFADIVNNTSLFESTSAELFSLGHMDLGAHNILIDDDYSFLAVIGWEFAQAAPWQRNHYPTALSLLPPDARCAGSNQRTSRSFTHDNLSSQLYTQKLREAERAFLRRGRVIPYSFLDVAYSAASQIFARFCRLGTDPEQDESFAREMVQLAFRYNASGTEGYLAKIMKRVSVLSGGLG